MRTPGRGSEVLRNSEAPERRQDSSEDWRVEGVHYWGLRAIADRLGYRNEYSVFTLWQQQGFPMFKRRGRHRMYRRHMWYTNDQLITAWELSKVQDQRRQWQRTGTTRALGRGREVAT